MFKIFHVREAEKGYGNTVKNLLIWFVRTNDAMMIDNFVKISEQSKVSEAVFQRCSYEKVFWKYAGNLHERPIPKCDFNKVVLLF